MRFRWLEDSDVRTLSARVLQMYDHNIDRWVDVPTVTKSPIAPVRARAFEDKDGNVRVMTESWATWDQLPRGGRWLGSEFLIYEDGVKP